MPEKLLKKAKEKVDKAQIYWREIDIMPVKFKDGKLEKAFRKKETQITLTVIYKGKIGVTYSTTFKDPDLLIEKAIQSAQYGEALDLEFPNQEPKNKINIYDEQITNLTLEDLIKNAKNIIERAKKFNKENFQINLIIKREINKVNILNTSGLNISYIKTPYSIHIGTPIPDSTTDIEFEEGKCKYFEIQDEILEDIFQRRRYCNIKVTVPTKKMDVIFLSEPLAALLYRLMVGVSGNSIEKKTSPLVDKLNTQIFDKSINIYDDPTIDWDINSIPFDEEGVLCYKKEIVKEGILKNFIFDLRTAKKTGNKSTGNGFKRTLFEAGLTTPINPYASNFILEKGNKTLEEMIKEVEEGIIVDMVLGMHSGNIVQGQYSMNVGGGYAIRNGKVEGRVIDAMVSGNIYEDFNKIKNIGNKYYLNFLGKSPVVHFKDIDVTCK